MRFVSCSFAVTLALVLATVAAQADDAKDAKDSKPTPTKTTPTKKTASRTDVAVGAALARCDDNVTLQTASGAGAGSLAQGVTPTSAPPGDTGIVASRGGGGLADIRGATKTSSDQAGSAREITLNVTNSDTPKTPKPVATVRMQRKMGVERTMAGLAPTFDGCRGKGGPSAGGTVAVQLDVSATGQVEHADAVQVKGVTKPTVACLLAAFGAAKFGAPGGTGAQLTVPITVSQDRGDVATSQ